MDKSYVTMEQKKCIVCNKQYDSGAILLDKRLRQRFDMYTLTGVGLCPDHTKAGYIALVEIDPKQSDRSSIYRTGTVIHIKADIWGKIFNSALPDSGFAVIDQEVTAKLRQMSGQ